ncbi:hypothetical protein HY417_01265 [Candidatus Kaiserbacteria bacterium]|nr:hypothetical protein [Candidatus Kaiserbacteria bacterium]
MRRLFFTAIVLIPAFALAAVQVGFPSQALWVSSTTLHEGETVVISTVVVNDTSSTLKGTVVFLANDVRVGAREFELGRAKSQIHSIEWKPKRGEYKLLARIEGTSAALSQKETPSLSVIVKEPLAPPSEIERTITQIVQTGSSIASSSAPVMQQTVQNIYAQTEALRTSGIERLEKYLTSNAKEGGRQGAIAGTSTANTTGFDSAPTKGKGALANLAQTAAAGGLFVLKNSALFYPLLALLVLGTIYLLARKIRRRPQDD